MGKKAKKSGNKSGKKKKGGKKKKADEVTWKEALLAYQINIKEKQMEDIRYEIRALEEKNERYRERNERLKEEQVHYIKLLLKQAREFESKLGDMKETEKHEVIQVMMDKWEAGRQEEKDIANIKEQIARNESHIVKEYRQVDYWTEYKNKGRHGHHKQIQLLEKELTDMQQSFDEMAGHLERTLNKAKNEISDYTENKLDKQKYLATEKAIAKMDKHSRQEVQDNDWLQREVELHKGEVAEMVRDVEACEQENLQIMSHLFECTVDDLKISREFYLTQFADDENVEENGVLEMDLSKLSINVSGQTKILPAPEPTGRPKSAVLTAIEKKLRALEAQGGAEQEGEEAVEEESLFDGDNGPEGGQDDPFNNYFHFDDEDFEDYLQLGPLELKMLNVKGHAMNIYKPRTPPLEELQAKQFKPDEWPITAPMMKKTVHGDAPKVNKYIEMARKK